MMGIGFPELMVILIIIMIIFGAGKLPQIGSAFGQSIKNFKSSMKEAAEEEAAESEASEDSAGESPVAQEGQEGGEIPNNPTETVAANKESTVKSQVQPSSQQTTATQGTKPKDKKKEEKSEEEKMIEDAIKELKEKRIGTIRTPHDGLVQQNDVFTDSLKRNPWGKGRDRGVQRDVL